jgi:hypothetical protein
VSVIFYGFNHPRYRDINAQDIFLLLNTSSHLMPVIGKQSLRREGSSFGEGIDFQQEYRNSVTKQILPWEGTPSVEQWDKASKILSHIDEVSNKPILTLTNSVNLSTSHLDFPLPLFLLEPAFELLPLSESCTCFVFFLNKPLFRFF